MPLIVIHFYYSNRFMEALSYIIHNLPPHQPQQACLACISLTVSCLLLLSTFKEVCVFTSSPLDTETAHAFLLRTDHLPLEAKNYEVICKEKTIKNHLRIFRSFPEINKLVLLAGERQEVSHTFLITQMQNSWDSSRLKSQEMGVEASHNINLPASLYILHAFLNQLSRKDIKE